MTIAIIGTGYVGLVSGACLADVGHRVICMDRDVLKIDSLQKGHIPIYEDGLELLVQRNTVAGRLSFTSSLVEALKGTEVVFLAIGTPQGDDGSADLSMVLEAATQIGLTMTAPLILVQKSTCPVGTVQLLEQRVTDALGARKLDIPFAVVSNPEFLREGNAVHDFMQPERVVIGVDDPTAGHKVKALYECFVPHERILLMDRSSAELTKYAANAFLATKISFMNDIANLCEYVGADVEQVRKGIGSDSRIGPAFLAAGIGYGGSCFPKDVKALLKTSRDKGYKLRVVEAVEVVNQDQRPRQLEKILRYFGNDVSGKRIGVWGLAFKPGTDDMREAPAIDITYHLAALGATVIAYDPVAAATAARVLDPRVRVVDNPVACAEGADALILVTEWPELVGMDLTHVGSRMNTRVLFDLRNGFSPEEAVVAGFTYFGVGRTSLANTK